MKARVPWKPTKAQENAMNREIDRQLLEHESKYRVDTDVMVLYALRLYTGFGKKRLRKFWEVLNRQREAMRAHYETGAPWNAGEELKKIGADVEEWRKEKEV